MAAGQRKKAPSPRGLAAKQTGGVRLLFILRVIKFLAALLGGVHTDLQEHKAENAGDGTGNESNQPRAAGKADDDSDCDARRQGTYHIGGGICADVAVPLYLNRMSAMSFFMLSFSF